MRASQRAAAAMLLAGLLAGCASHFIEVPPSADVKTSRAGDALTAVRALGHNGDWLVIRGYHLSDDLVATLTNVPFSHAAMLDHDAEIVIEAEAAGVHTSTLADFVGKAHRVLLIRPVWANDVTAVAPGQLYYWGRVLYDSGAL